MSKKREQIEAAMAASKAAKSGLKLVETTGSKPAPVMPPGIKSAPKAGAVGSPNTKLPPLPRAKRSKKKTPKSCECGCGDMTAGGRFIPGHDSKLKAWALRVERKLIKLSDIEHEGVREAVRKLLKIGGTATMVAKPKTAPPATAKEKAVTAEKASVARIVKSKPAPKPIVVEDDVDAELEALDAAEEAARNADVD